jgi:nucleotide-binding universal stress UspA family protein
MKVLIAVDESPFSEKAIDYCLHSEEWDKDTDFLIISVVQPIVGEYALGATYIESIIEAEEQIKDHRQKMIQEMIAKLQGKYGKEKVSGMTYTGFVRESILTVASSWQADLIIVGSHGRRGFSKFLLGSVAEAIAREAQCSVLIVKDALSTKPAEAEEAAATAT